jgi:hypothetical protein
VYSFATTKYVEKMNAMVYLKPNLVIEPLVGKWYAWSHLISPSTAAMNITKRHMEIMNSYLDSPQMHHEAVKDATMLGGPFMDFETDRSDDVSTLLNDTVEKQSQLIALSFAIKKLDKLLKFHPAGFALESLYEKVPDILKGYVELVYDVNNNVSFRFFEELLYKSPFYDDSHQSIALWITNNDERPFCLSTPRLSEPNVLHLPIPFKSSLIDELSKMKRTPRAYSEIEALFDLSENDKALFRTFFTEEAPVPYKKYEGDKIRMRYFGHACILVETKDGLSIDSVAKATGNDYPQLITCINGPRSTCFDSLGSNLFFDHKNLKGGYAMMFGSIDDGTKKDSVLVGVFSCTQF